MPDSPRSSRTPLPARLRRRLGALLAALPVLAACPPTEPAVVDDSTSTGPDEGSSTGPSEPSSTSETPGSDGTTSTGMVDEGSTSSGDEGSTSSGDEGSTSSGDEGSTSSGDEGSTSSGDTGTTSPAICGDGIVDGDEACDGPALGGATCQSLGLSPGPLACDEQCAYDTSGCVLPGVPVLALGVSPIKQFDFSWGATADAEHYELLESPALGEPFGPLGGAILGESISWTMPLHLRHEASYVLRACSGLGCSESAPVGVAGSLAAAVGYVKASNTDPDDRFGGSVVLSGDGSTLFVGAHMEDGGAPGIDGDQADDSLPSAGAVYVLVRDDAGQWSQQAYLKASNPGASDFFGWSLAASTDGDTLAVGARFEDGSAPGIDGNQADDSASNAGAVYVFVRDGAGQWSQQAYVKASNPGADDGFGYDVALSTDGSTLAVGAPGEASSATGIGGNQADDSATLAGAVYVLVRDGAGQWSQQAYVKASNTGVSDQFGHAVALGGDGNTLAVGAVDEASGAAGIDGNQADDSMPSAGAAYVLVRDGAGQWSQQAYVKASNPGVLDDFGHDVALSSDGNTLVVGAPWEDGSATGIDGPQDDAAGDSGAVYVLVRDGVGQWSQQAYVKASNTGGGDRFGEGVALSGDGSTLAVGAPWEDGNAPGIGGNEADDSLGEAGAAYVLVRDGMGQWSPRSYVKAPSPDGIDLFGNNVALSDDGRTLAVGTHAEDGSSTGIGGNQASDAAISAGAVWLY